jgi:hypothetical protein
MTNHHVARIQWLHSVEGGRKQPPSGPTYTTVARFEQQGDQWINDAWSLVLDFVGAPDDDLCHLAKVRFLAEGAPSDWLREGSKFELMEGSKVVAKGIIIRT